MVFFKDIWISILFFVLVSFRWSLLNFVIRGLFSIFFFFCFFKFYWFVILFFFDLFVLVGFLLCVFNFGLGGLSCIGFGLLLRMVDMEEWGEWVCLWIVEVMEMYLEMMREMGLMVMEIGLFWYCIWGELYFVCGVEGKGGWGVFMLFVIIELLLWSMVWELCFDEFGVVN